MDSSLPNKAPSLQLKAVRQSFSEWLHRRIVVEKLRNGVGFLILLAIGIGFSLLIAVLGLEAGVIAWALMLGIPLVAAMMIDLFFGVAFIVGISFFLMGIKKIIDIPLGIMLDAGIVILFFGMMADQMGKRDWSFARNPISALVLLWIVYNLLEFANPVAASRMAWFYTVRGMAGTIVLYFLVLYVMTDLHRVKQLIKLIAGLSLLAALYGMVQEHYGLMPWEKRWLHSDIQNYKLIYQWGRIRIWSFLSDPTTFGILMAYMSLFCFVLVSGPFRWQRRLLLLVSGGLMLLASTYSGTRTAFALIPVGVIFFGLLSMKREVIIAVVIFMLFGSALMMKSSSNPTLYRIQSTFQPSKDRSMATRLKNQAFIKPFIQTHPIGGGLGSTGTWGQRFSPNNPLAHFPPDSGYVRIAVELGWIGLLIYCAMLFIILAKGIEYYIRVRDPVIKTIYAAVISVIFSLAVVNYTQEALILLPNSIIFYVFIAAVVRLKDFDPYYTAALVEQDTVKPKA